MSTKWMQREVPGFVQRCWVSELKHHYFPESRNVANDMGADFRYLDRAGKISGSGRSETVYLEVKSQTQEEVQPFRMSVNEWNRAKRCHMGPNEVYIVVIVTAVTHAPRIAQLIIDPIRQVNDGAATVEISELVYTPNVTSSV